MSKLISFFRLFIVLSIITGTIRAQVTQEWVNRYSGPFTLNNGNWPNSIAVDGSGNVFVTGWSAKSGSTGDYTTIKYNSSGIQEWARQYNGPGNGSDLAYDIKVDRLGNVYVTGSSFGTGTGQDYATIKYNSSGIEQWVQRYNGPGNSLDASFSIALDGSGNVYVTGYSRSGSITGTEDFVTLKYNSAGVEQWVQRYNGPGNGFELTKAIVVDGSGNVYVTGQSAGIGTNYDYATIKYNTSGIEQWVQRYNGPGNNFDNATSLTVNDLGDVYVTGNSVGIGTGYDYATIKYNSAGIEQWVQRYSGPGNNYDNAASIAVDGLNNVYLTGWSSNSGGHYDMDYATIKYNSTGTQEWVQRYNGPGNEMDAAHSLAVDGSGNVYVTGNSMAGSSNGSGFKYDYATIKYNTSGIEQWVQRYNGPNSFSDYGESIAVDCSGNVYVTGYSLGIGAGPAGIDFATIKYSQCSQQCNQFNVSIGPDITVYNGYGEGNTTLTANVTGGIPPYTYLWSNNSTTQSIIVNPVITTSYSVTVSEKNNCLGNNTVTVSVVDIRCGNNNDKVLICHNGQTICISPNAVSAHLAHGDHLGSCGDYPEIIPGNLPAVYKLNLNYPNPFNPVTKISFDIPIQGLVTLKIYDIIGREVRTLVNEVKSPGSYAVDFNGAELSSGVYFYRLQSADFTDIKRMTLIK